MLQHSTLTDNVVDVIRKMIINGTFQPGERINQVALAQELNISRGPLREALRMLQKEGLVKHETNRGTFVSTLSHTDAWEIYTLRALLESEAAQLAVASMSESELLVLEQRLEQLLADFESAYRANDFEALAKCDTHFHQVIVDASKHSRLKMMHQQLDTQVGAMLVTMATKVPIRIQKVVEIHRVLLDALRSRDKERVKQEFSAHYLDALKDLQARGRL